MQKNVNPKKIEVNIRTLLNKLVVDKDRVNEFEELSKFIRHARTFKINEFWRCQTNAPILKITYDGSTKELIGWVIYLADFGEIQHGMADVYYKGVIASSLNFKDKTPYTSVINANTDNIVIISLGGYASLIKPKIY